MCDCPITFWRLFRLLGTGEYITIWEKSEELDEECNPKTDKIIADTSSTEIANLEPIISDDFKNARVLSIEDCYGVLRITIERHKKEIKEYE